MLHPQTRTWVNTLGLPRAGWALLELTVALSRVHLLNNKAAKGYYGVQCIYLILAVTGFTADCSWRKTLFFRIMPRHLSWSTEWKLGLPNVTWLAKTVFSTSHLKDVVAISSIEMFTMEIFCER